MPKSWRFDGRPILQGVSMTFSRDVASMDPTGVAVAADTPRYDAEQIVCGAPRVTALIDQPSGAPTANMQVEAACYDSQGVPCLIVMTFEAGTGQFRLYRGLPAASNELGLNMDIMAGSTTSTRNATSKTNISGSRQIFIDWFVEHHSLSAVSNYADECWIVRTLRASRGHIVGHFNVATRTGADWASATKDKVGIAAADISAIVANPSDCSQWFRQIAKSPALHATTADDLNLGAHWALAGPFYPHSENEAWYVGVDYANANYKNSGVAFILRARTTDNGATWTWGKVRELPGSSYSGFSNTRHEHSYGIVAAGATGIRIIGAGGDDTANQIVRVWELADVSSYDTLDNGSRVLVDGGTNWLQYSSGTDDLLGPFTVAGWRNGTGTPDNATFLDTEDRALTNQWVGNAPGPNGTLLASNDELKTIISRLTPVGSGGVQEFSAVFAPICHELTTPRNQNDSVLNQRNTVAFQIATAAGLAAGPYATHIGAGASVFDQLRKNRLAVSPDGLLWGKCFAPIENVLTKLAILSTGPNSASLFTGSFAQALGNAVRKVDVTWKRGRPLLTSPGGKNYASTSTSPATVDAAGVTISSANPTLDSGLAAPPCPVQRYFGVEYAATDGTSSPRVLSWVLSTTLANAVADRCHYAAAHLFICNRVPTAWPGTDRSTSFQAKHRLDYYNQTDTSNVIAGGYTAAVTVDAHGQWTLVPLSSYRYAYARNVSTARGPFADKNSGNTDLAMQWRPETANGTPLPSNIYVALAGVYGWGSDGGDIPYPMAAGVTGTDELAEVTGLNLTVAAGWTWVETMHIADGTWDDESPCAWSGACTFTSATTLTLTHDASLDTTAGIALANFLVGHRCIARNSSGVLASSSNGKTITASSYSSPTLTITCAAGWDNSINSGTGSCMITSNADRFRRKLLVTVCAEDETEGMSFWVYTSNLSTGDGDPKNNETSCIVAAIYSSGAYGTTEGTDWNDFDPEDTYNTPLFFDPRDPIHVGAASSASGTITAAISAGGCEVVTKTFNFTQTKPWTKVLYGRGLDGSTGAPVARWGGYAEETGPADDAERLTELMQNLEHLGSSGSVTRRALNLGLIGRVLV